MKPPLAPDMNSLWTVPLSLDSTHPALPLDWKLLPDHHALIALGSNLASPVYGQPAQVLNAAVAALAAHQIRVIAVAKYYETEPDPPSDQPLYLNSAALVASEMAPSELLASLHLIEAEFGRQRQIRNEARVLDLDLLAFGTMVIKPKTAAESELTLPHPRLHQRLFVLQPLSDIVPQWRHTVRALTVTEMIARL